MAIYLLENGKDLCRVSDLRFYRGAQEVIEVPVLGGGGHIVPGRKEPDRVTFLMPVGTWPNIQGNAAHQLRDDENNVRRILITQVGGGGGEGVAVHAIVPTE